MSKESISRRALLASGLVGGATGSFSSHTDIEKRDAEVAALKAQVQFLRDTLKLERSWVKPSITQDIDVIVVVRFESSAVWQQVFVNNQEVSISEFIRMFDGVASLIIEWIILDWTSPMEIRRSVEVSDTASDHLLLRRLFGCGVEASVQCRKWTKMIVVSGE